MLMPRSAAYALNSRWNSSGTLKFIGVRSVGDVFSRLPTVFVGAGGAPFREGFGGGTLATASYLPVLELAHEVHNPLRDLISSVIQRSKPCFGQCAALIARPPVRDFLRHCTIED